MASVLRWAVELDTALGEAVYRASRRSCWRHVATVTSLLVDEGVWFLCPVVLLLVRLVLDAGVAGTREYGAWLAALTFGSLGATFFAEMFNEAMMMTCVCAALKLILRRERPAYAPQDKHYIVNGDRYAFPSGHTFWAAYVQRRGLALLAGVGAPAASCSLALPFTALVAWSRVAKGRHFPSDTLIGGTIGMLAAEAPLRLEAVAWGQFKLIPLVFCSGEMLLAVVFPRFRTPGFSTGALLLTTAYSLLPSTLAPPLGQQICYPIAVVAALFSALQHPRLILSFTPSNTSMLSRTRARLKVS